MLGIIVYIGTKLEDGVVLAVVDPVAVVKTPQLLRGRTIIADCQICNANLVIVTREERCDACNNIHGIGLDNPFIVNHDENLAADWAPVNLHYIIIPGLNLRKLNEMLVIKVFNGRRRDVDAVEIQLERKGKEKEKDAKEERGSMRARVTFLG